MPDTLRLIPHSYSSKIEFFNGPPCVFVTPAAYEKMCLYVDIGDKEVGWLGTASRLPDGNFLIEDVFLFDQMVGAIETEISSDGLAAFADELLADGEAGIEKWNKLRFWGHSHAHMGTSPSTTDEATMATFRHVGHDWFLRGIFNKFGRAEFTIYLYDVGVCIQDAPWTTYNPLDASLRATIEAEFAAKVQERAVPVQVPFDRYFGFEREEYLPLSAEGGYPSNLAMRLALESCP